MRVATITPPLFPELPAFAVPPPSALPRGFSYEPGFLSVEEERELLGQIGALSLRNSQWHEYTALRRTASFGLRWHSGDGADDAGLEPAAPLFLVRLAAKVARHCGLPVAAFPHVLVTEYPPGAPIGWHRDAPPFAAIYGVSLAGACDFRLRPMDFSGAGLQTRGSMAGLKTSPTVVHVPVEPRSLYVLRGPARSAWQHSIPPVKALRYSVTLRTLCG